MISSLTETHELLEQKQLQIEELTKKLQSAQRNITMLQHQVDQLLRRVYGRRSEKLDPKQLLFDPLVLEAVQQHEQESPLPVELPAAPSSTEKKSRKSARRHPGRIPIPEHLERVEILLDIPEEQKICPVGGGALGSMGTPVKVDVNGKPVFICCEGCEEPLLADPEKHLAKLGSKEPES